MDIDLQIAQEIIFSDAQKHNFLGINDEIYQSSYFKMNVDIE